MTGRESLIGVGLAVVLVVGIIDAAVGDDDASKSPSTSGVPVATSSAQPSDQPSTEPTSTSEVTASGGGHHHHRGGAAAAASASAMSEPTAATPTSAAPTPASSSGSATPVPDGVLGTFSYTTTGGEGTNIPGTQRDFPKTTKITNKLAGCGISSTWKPIQEHVQKQVLCPASDGVKVKSYKTTISFYGVSSGEDFTCSGDSYVYRDHVTAGDTWHFKCKSPDAVAVQTSRAVGYKTINVGGTAVRTLHIHVDTKLKGDDSGTSSQDYWIATKKPVLVKEAGTITATQQNVHYSSTYSLLLKSLSPKT